MKKVNMKKATADLITGAEVVVGVMGAHGLKNVLPMENEMVKAAIPTVLGAGAIIGSQMVPKGGNHIKSVGYGLLAYGALSLIRAGLTSSDAPGGDPGSMGVMGIGENPTIQKLVDNFIPNLGNVETTNNIIDYADAYDPQYEANLVEEIDYDYESINGLENDLDSVFLNGVENDLDSVFMQY